MTPEELVPTLETCKLLEWDKNTYFVWAYSPVLHDKWHLYHREDSLLYGKYPIQIIQAPTLQELLEDIFASGYRVPAVYSAEAAALLWLELRKENKQ